MEIIRRNLDEIKRVFRVLESRTKKLLIGMTIFTLTVSVMMFKVFENPIINNWRDNKETQQLMKVREERLNKEKLEKEEREKEKIEVEDKEDGNKEPKF